MAITVKNIMLQCHLMDFVVKEERMIRRMVKCKHNWQITHASNVLQQDEMGYPLRLFIQKCSKCEKCLEEIKTGRFVLCKWEY